MKQKVALVLSSGGSRGLAHIGVINELEKRGFEITSVSGSSIGSVIGGVYAMGKLSEYTDWLRKLDQTSIWGLMDFTLSTSGLMKGEKVFQKMKTFIPDVPIEDLKIPFVAVATDILNRKEVAFNSGSFYEAIRASVAIPTVITPVKYKDTILVDGGVLDPIPIDHIARTKGDILVVVNLYGDNEGEYEKSKNTVKTNSFPKTLNDFISSISNLMSSGDKRSLGYVSLLTATTSAMIGKLAKHTVEKHQPDILINIPAGSSNTFDFHKSDGLIELGRKTAAKEITAYKKK